MNRKLLCLPAAGIAFVAAVSAGMPLLSTANRVGPPESVLELSNKEVALPSEETGSTNESPLTFRIKWRVESPGSWLDRTGPASLQQASWITKEKLDQLKAPLPIPGGSEVWLSVLLVLELNGAAYERDRTRSCFSRQLVTANDCNQLADSFATRLYVIDAGKKVEDLRRQYPDRSKYAIANGTIRVTRPSPTEAIVGYVDELNDETVQGREPLRSAIEAKTGQMLWHRLSSPTAFTVSIAFGRRLEPWVVAVKY